MWVQYAYADLKPSILSNPNTWALPFMNFDRELIFEFLDPASGGYVLFL